MDKPELLILKITSPNSYKFILNLYKTYSLKEIRKNELYYILKINYLKARQSQKEYILKYKDKLTLLLYEKEIRLYKNFIQNSKDNNNLDQFGTEYWYND